MVAIGTVPVPLSNGTAYNVGELSWGTYKKIKARVLSMMAQDLTQVFSLVSQQDWQGIGELVARLVSELEEPFVAGCIKEAGDLPAGFFESLSRSDFHKLSAKAAELNPLKDILEMEKNSVSGGLIREVIQALATNSQAQDHLNSVLGGGSLSSTPSPNAPAGVPAN